MARQTRTLGLVAVVILTVMGAALWLVLSGDESVPEKVAEAPAEVEDRSQEKEIAKKKAERARRRARPEGTATLFGVVKRKVGEKEEPAAGQVVELLFPDGEPVQAETRDDGEFRFEKLQHGSPYEVRCSAAGYATVRITGIALERNDQYDLGTLLLDAAVSVTVYVKSMSDEALAGAAVNAYANPEFGGGFNWTQRMSQIGVEPEAVASATTDGEGMAHFPELAAGNWTFVAQKDGYARQGKKGERLRANEETEPLEIYLGRGYRLRGRVLDHEEQPIAGAHVMAGSNANVWDFQSGPLRTHATSAEDGAYAFDMLPSGNITLWAAKGDGVPTVVATLRVPAVSEFDMYLRSGGILKGTVTEKDKDTPLEDVIVRASGWSNGGYRIAEATSDAEGNYVIDDLLEGQVNSVVAEKEGYVQVFAKGENRWSQIGLTEGGEVVKNLEMAKGSTLTGVVSGPNGPLSGVRVVVYVTGGGWSASQTATSDGEGKYRITGLAKGKALIQLTKAGYYQPDFPQNWWQALQNGSGPEEYSPDIPDGEDSEFDVSMKAGVVVTGRVIDEEQNPVAGVTIRASVAGVTGQQTATSKADGTFELAGALPAKQLNFWTQKKGYRTATKQFHAPDEGVEQEELELEIKKTAKVTGMVTSTTGEPMVDGYVFLLFVNNNARLNPFASRNAARAPVRQDGTYELDMGYNTGKFTVVGAAFGHADTASDAVEIVDGQDTYQVDLVLEQGFTLRGQVNAADAPNGVAGATVTVTIKRKQNPRGGMVSSSGGGGVPILAVTDAEGRFEIQHIDEGAWSVKVDAQDYVEGEGEAKIPGTSDVTIDLEPSLEISGTVVFGDGKPVPGATVSAVREDATGNQSYYNPWAGGTFSTDKDGRFTIRNLYKGTYFINVMPPWGSTLNVTPMKSDPVEAGSEDFRIVAEAGGVIAGRVTGSDGKGVQGVYVNANPMKHDPKHPMSHRGSQTEEDGSFEIVGLRNVQYRVQVSASQVAGASYRDVTLQDITPGRKDLKIELVEGLKITGKVVDSEGKPVRNLWVQANYVKQGDEKTPSNANKNAMLDEKGEFEIKGLVPGTFKLSLQNWGRHGAKGLLLQGGDSVQAGTTDLRLTAITGLSISGVVVDDSGAGVPNVWVNAQATKSGTRIQRNSRTDDEGKFEISGLEGGTTYSVSAYMQGRPNETRKDVEPGTSDLRFVMAEGLKATGTIVDASGTALANVSVNLKHVDSKKSLHARTNNKGAFEAQGLEEGTYEVSYYKQGDDNKWVPVSCGTLNAGDTGVRLQASE